MQLNRKHPICALLLGMLFCTAGCAVNDEISSSKPPAATELPPLVTTAPTDTTLAETEETTLSSKAELLEPAFEADLTAWKLPEELGTLQMVRVHNDEVYLLGIQQDEAKQTQSVLFHATADPEPVFTPLFTNANAADFVGLTDFDVLSDGSICGLICEDGNEVPYEDPTFNPDEFDWETYYENYTTQYRLVWYNADGAITQKLGLSTLLDLDETARQTMAFTGVRCDASDHVYLTATIDEEECLMALDGKGNLCPIQGNNAKMLSLESNYQWVRCGTDGMLLLECDVDDTLKLSHLVITDDSLWKTQISAPDRLAVNTMLAEMENWYGIWDQDGLYCVSEKNVSPELLYAWDDMHLDVTEVSRVLVLSEAKVLLTTYTTQGNLIVQLIAPEIENPVETQTAPAVTDTGAGQEPPPVATPVNFS